MDCDVRPSRSTTIPCSGSGCVHGKRSMEDIPLIKDSGERSTAVSFVWRETYSPWQYLRSSGIAVSFVWRETYSPWQYLRSSGIAVTTRSSCSDSLLAIVTVRDRSIGGYGAST